MTNPNDNKSYREVQQDSYTDSNGNIHTNVTRTTETVGNRGVDPNSYQDGYVHGRVSERDYQEERLAQRDDDNTARGLFLGLLLALLAGLTGIAIWYFTQRDEAVENTVTPTVTVTPTTTPQPQTTIIERTTEVPVPVERTREVPVPIPVPQQNTSSTTAPTPPNINITVPPEPPAARQTTPASPSNSNPETGTTATPSPDLTPNNNSSNTENSNQNNSSQ
jgi:hypothetical protein